MKSKLFLVIIFLSSTLLFSCGEPVSDEAFAKVTVGMSTTDMINLIGEPNDKAKVESRTSNTGETIWYYGSNQVVRVVGGKVQEVITDPEEIGLLEDLIMHEVGGNLPSR